MSLDQTINNLFTPVSDALASVIFASIPVTEGISVPLILVWLAAISMFLTVYMGFVNIRYFTHGIKLLTDKQEKEADEKAEGEITRFQALTTTLSGTVGLGNIAMVAVAISIGGPGAIVWMILMGLFGMTTKFVEATLGVKYRRKYGEGHFSGGPMYYIKEVFSQRGLGKVGMILAGFFAICVVGGAIGAGNMFQANQTFNQVLNVTGGDDSWLMGYGWLFGLVLASLVAAVIIGGIHSIANVASRIVPFMAVLYVITGLIVIGAHITALPAAVVTIFQMAFTPEAGMGGVIGGILQGVRRAAFSNEAGVGSAAISHAVVKTRYPVQQGFVAMLGPFIDTCIICVITALVIVVSGVPLGTDVEGITLTSRAFESVMPWYPPLLAFIVFMFAFSTMITWSYYGVKGWTYLFGEKPMVVFIFKVMFCLFVVLGCSSELTAVINFSDALFFAMAIPNVIALYMFAPEIKRDLKNYLQTFESKVKK